MSLKPLHAFLVAVVGFLALVAGIGFIYWPAALVIGGAMLMVYGMLIVQIRADDQEDAAPLERIPDR